MNNILLPNREQKPFEESKCSVNLSQIESLIEKYETDLEKLQAKFERDDDTRKVTGDLMSRVEAKISVLKDLRHMAYTNGNSNN